MIGVTTALIGLAAYVAIVFVVGLAWRGREISQRRNKRMAAEVPRERAARFVDREEYAELQG